MHVPLLARPTAQCLRLRISQRFRAWTLAVALLTVVCGRRRARRAKTTTSPNRPRTSLSKHATA